LAKSNDKVKTYNAWTNRASSASSIAFRYKKQCEEFYYSDVNDTKTQFTENQQDKIINTYNIPISTKISYAIIEQLLSFLTGSKPFPRLIAGDDSVSDFIESLSKGYHGVWYESRADRELKNALRDALNTGDGFLQVRENNFYNETAFNVMIEHKPWKHWFIDPDSRKCDFSDAEFIIFADMIPAKKAENEYGITIDKETLKSMPDGINALVGVNMSIPDYTSSWGSEDVKVKYVLLRKIWFKEEINVYMSDDGFVSTQRPIPIDIPNETKQQLLSEIQNNQSQIAQGSQTQTQGMQLAENTDPLIQADTDTQFQEQVSQQMDNQKGLGQTDQVLAQLQNENQVKMKEASQMPDLIPGFEFTSDSDGTKRQIQSFTKIRRKRIKCAIMVGDKILEEDYLPIERYPIVHFTFSHNGSPNKTYGIIHYIMDLVKAMNKFWALLIYDMQSNGMRKVLAPRTSIVQVKQFEQSWSTPGSLNLYEPDPSLPNNGQPIVVDPSPMNQNISYILQAFLQLVEYITGINSIMQGDAAGAPQTMGGIQSLQSFGTQMVKMFARDIETALEDLSVATIGFLQAYAPRDKWIQYFDAEDKPQSVQFLDMPDDLSFKVRVDIVNSMPTYKQMFAQLLGSISGQTKNPYVADALTKTMLKLIDAPESRQLAEDIDTIKMMEGQIQSKDKETKDLQNRINMLENNLYQAELANRIDTASLKAEGDIKAVKAKQQAEALGTAGAPHMSEIEALKPNTEQLANTFSQIPVQE